MYIKEMGMFQKVGNQDDAKRHWQRKDQNIFLGNFISYFASKIPRKLDEMFFPALPAAAFTQEIHVILKLTAKDFFLQSFKSFDFKELRTFKNMAKYI